jgi:hypothetical protein
MAGGIRRRPRRPRPKPAAPDPVDDDEEPVLGFFDDDIARDDDAPGQDEFAVDDEAPAPEHPTPGPYEPRDAED